jgi:sn-glycerol 3-phosphate transport system ATP-binding protein
LGDRVVVMKDGIVQQVGEPLELYNRPANRFVAGFIGSPAMNFIAGKVADSRQSIDLAGVGIQINLPLNGPTAAAPGTPVSVGIRPEHLVPYASGPLEFEIELAEPLGADTLLHGRFGAARDLVTIRQPGHVLAKPGEKRRFNVDAKHIHLFEQQSGKRIAGG